MYIVRIRRFCLNKSFEQAHDDQFVSASNNKIIKNNNECAWAPTGELIAIENIQKKKTNETIYELLAKEQTVVTETLDADMNHTSYCSV